VMSGRQLRSVSRAPRAILVACLLLLAACDDARPGAPGTASESSARSSSGSSGGGAVVPVASGPTVIFLGDSLTAGYGLAEDEAFPALVAEALESDGRAIRLVNAGVSGDTTAGGLARVDWLLKQEPKVLVVGLGGNDGLRGLDLEMSETNLRQIIERAQEAGAIVILLGMLLPPNYGPDYTERFSAIYPRLGEAYGVILVPFLLEGVGGDPDLNLPDGIHPTARGHEIVARTVLPYVREALDRAGG